MDAQLSVNDYLAGPEYTIADIITWPWAMLIGRMIDETMWETFPHLKRWVDTVRERPAVETGYRVGRDLGRRELSEEEEKQRRELLFNQTNEKVRHAREELRRQPHDGSSDPARARGRCFYCVDDGRRKPMEYDVRSRL